MPISRKLRLASEVFRLESGSYEATQGIPFKPSMSNMTLSSPMAGRTAYLMSSDGSRGPKGAGAEIKSRLREPLIGVLADLRASLASKIEPEQQAISRARDAYRNAVWDLLSALSVIARTRPLIPNLPKGQVRQVGDQSLMIEA